VLFIYLDKKDDSLQTPKTILGSMLSQIMQEKSPETLPKSLQDAFRISGKGELQPKLSDSCRRQLGKNCQDENCIRDLLYTELKSNGQAFLVVDALDECRESLRYWVYRELITLQEAGVTILTSSRPIEHWKPIEIFCDQCISQGHKKALRMYWHCKDCDKNPDEQFGGFDLCGNCKSSGITCRHGVDHVFEVKDVELVIRIPDESLKRFLVSEMNRELGEESVGSIDRRLHSQIPAGRFGRMLQGNKDIIEPLSNSIVEMSDGKFLFAKLYLLTLKTQHNKEGVQNCLRVLPKTLPDIYDKMIRRIKNQDEEDSKIALKILSYLTVAKQTMTLQQLQHALAVQTGDSTINTNRIMDAELILDITQGLVIIDTHTDGSRSTIRLFHLTLQDYLESSISTWFPTAHVDIALASLNYLQLTIFSEASSHWTEFQKKAETHPFVSYCSYWGDHMRASLQFDKSEELEKMALDYLRQPHRMNAFSQATWCAQSGYSDHWDVRRGVSCVHVVAWFGLDGIISTLCEENDEYLDQVETTYFQTPLMYACRRGHTMAVQQLLKLGADVKIKSGLGLTALMEAVGGGHPEVVGLLLSSENGRVVINEPNEEKSNRTALMMAVQNCHVEIVQQLLSYSEIDINVQDSGRFTTLIHAVRKHAELNWEILTIENSTDEMAAKLHDYEGILQMLLAKPGLNLNSIDILGKSALVFAAELDDANVVTMLLERGASSTIKDNQDGAVAIMNAVERGCKMALDSMLEYGVDLSCLDDNGRTIMHYAASSSSINADSIVKLLYEKGLNIDAVDKFNRSPLMQASQVGSLPVVKFLLSKGASRSRVDSFGRTAFKIAWEYQCNSTDLLDVLKDEYSETDSLSWIKPSWSLAKFGLIDELLLRDVSLRDGREPITLNTALHWAIMENQVVVWSRLLNILDSDFVDLADCSGRTALHFAVLFRHEGALKQLIAREANLNIKDRWGCTPIMIANAIWRFELAVLLCAAGATLWEGLDLKAILFRAVELNNVDAIKTLIDAGVHILSRNENGQTVLDIAKERGEEADEIYQILSQRTFYLKKQDGNKVAEVKVEGFGPKQDMAFPMPFDAREESARVNSTSLLEPTVNETEERLQTILWPKIPLTPPLTPDLSRTFGGDSPTETENRASLTEQEQVAAS
jgi:ankyrin repeat protein